MGIFFQGNGGQDITTLVAAPANPQVGQMYYDTTLQAVGIYESTGWAYLVEVPSGVPTGAIQAFGAATCPIGWLPCDNTSGPTSNGIYPIPSYPALGALLGATYGGDGTTTFGVPNLVGQFVQGSVTGVTPGAAGGSTTHDHSIGSVNTASAAGGHTHGPGNYQIAAHNHTAPSSTTPAHTHGLTAAYAFIDSAGTAVSSQRQTVTSWTATVNVAGTATGVLPVNTNATQLGGSTDASAVLTDTVGATGTQAILGVSGASTGSAAAQAVTGTTDNNATTTAPPYLAMPYIIKT